MKARTAVVAYAKEETRGLTEIDRIAMLHHVAKLCKDDLVYLRSVQCVGRCGKAELFDMGLRADAICDYCLEARCTYEHQIWVCPHFQKIREEAAPDLAKGPMRYLHLAVRRGIAPAMTCRHGRAYWGTNVLAAADHVTTDELKLLGSLDEWPTTAARKLIGRATDLGFNARQVIANARGPFGQGVNPDIPDGVEGASPDDINRFSDGSLKSPTNPAWALGGFGVWRPMQHDGQRDDDVTSTVIADAAYQLSSNSAHLYRDQDGEGLFGKLPGQRYSSTRTEVAGLISAIIEPVAVHVGLDNAAAVKKATNLLGEASRRVNHDDEHWWLRGNPCKRPWALQTDGDLWELFW